MSSGTEFQQEKFEVELEAIATVVKMSAQHHRGNGLALLALLRLLETLHREVRDGLFQESLPDNRQALYALLKDIEANGGWPYIHRMKLRSLLANLTLDALGEEA